jgi:hypothetical protein
MSTLGKTKYKETVTYDTGKIVVTAYRPKPIYGPPKPKTKKKKKRSARGY